MEMCGASKKFVCVFSFYSRAVLRKIVRNPRRDRRRVDFFLIHQKALVCVVLFLPLMTGREDRDVCKIWAGYVSISKSYD